MTQKTYDIGTQILLDDLAAAPQSFDRDEIIRRARRYKYHDYKSDVTANEVLLIEHLTKAGLKDLARNAASGKYDQQKDASDEWAKTPDGQHMRALIENDPAMRDRLNKIYETLPGSRFAKDVEEQAEHYIETTAPSTDRKGS